MELYKRHSVIERASELMNELSIDPIKALTMAEKELEEQYKKENELCY